MAKKKPYPVEVVWKDAHGMYPNWEDIRESPEEDNEGMYIVSTVGYLLPKRKKGHHVVALNLSDYHVGDGIAIPDGMVVSVSKLIPAPKKKRK